LPFSLDEIDEFKVSTVHLELRAPIRTKVTEAVCISTLCEEDLKLRASEGNDEGKHRDWKKDWRHNCYIKSSARDTRAAPIPYMVDAIVNR